MKPTFIVWSPSYFENSGGIIALHLLAHEISKLGYTCFLKTAAKNPKWRGDILIDGQKIDWDTTIVIYPEIVCGNPLNAKHVVRWVLNTPGVCAGDGIYADTDMVFLYWNYFTLKRSDLVLGELRQFTIDTDIFNNLNQSRSGQCFAIKKGKSKVLDKHSADAILIDNLPKNRLQKIFNEKEVFINYDHVSHLSIQAALSGCISVVIPDGKHTREEWQAKLPIFKYGIAYGLEDIEWSKSTLPQVLPYLESLIEENAKLLSNFIDICAKKTGIGTKQMVDVIIPSKTKEGAIEITRNCIESLRDSEQDFKFNVVIVESGGDVCDVGQDSTIMMNCPFNYNKALNLGANSCSADWVVLANNDLIFHKNWFSAIIKANKDHHNIVSFSPWDNNHHNTRMTLDRDIYEGYTVGLEIAGWCIVVKREILKQISLGEHVSFWYSDDVYSDELKRHDFRHALIRQSKVDHLVSKTLMYGDTSEEQRNELTWKQRKIHEEKRAVYSIIGSSKRLLTSEACYANQDIKQIDLSNFWCTYSEYDFVIIDSSKATDTVIEFFKKKNIGLVIINATSFKPKQEASDSLTRLGSILFSKPEQLDEFNAFCKQILIIVTVFNRPEVTRVALESLEKTRRQAELWIYDDCSELTEEFLREAAPKAEKIMKLKRNLSVSRLRFHIQNIAFSSKFRYVYHTDNDVIHDPYWLNRIFEISKEHDGPIGLYNAVPHLCWTKSEDKINKLDIRDACPGVSFFYDQLVLKTKQSPMKYDPYFSKKMESVPVWDFYIGDLFSRTKPITMIAISTVSYVEHFGASGLHSKQVDRALNPTEWLINKRKDIVDKLPFAALMASPMIAEPAIYVANLRSMGDLIGAAPAIKWAIENLHKDGRYHVLVPRGYEELFHFVPANKLASTAEKPNLTSPWHFRYLRDKYTPVGSSMVTAQKMHLSQFASIKFLDRILPDNLLDYVPLPDVPVDHFGVDFSKAILISTTYCCGQRWWAPNALKEVILHVNKLGFTPVYLGKRLDDKNGGTCGTEELPLLGADLRDKTTITQLASIMKKSLMIVGIDNGLIHLAGTTDIPIVCGYTITRPETRIPLRQVGKTFAIVPPETSCRFCLTDWLTEYFCYDKCYYGHSECTNYMTSDKFIDAMNVILQEKGLL